jgi:DNA helicase-2/ATP-dependent DNA helicase PcrA
VLCSLQRQEQLEAEAKIGRSKDASVLTFNGMGHRIVMRNFHHVKPDDAVERDRIQAVVDNDSEFRHITSKYHPAAIRKLVGFLKNTCPRIPTADDVANIAERYGIDLDDGFDRKGWTFELVLRAAELAVKASTTPDAQGRISFNDQIWLPVVMGWARPTYDALFVDECQDMCETQLAMASKVCRGRMVLIGDPDQAIFAFRGAAPGGMEKMISKLKAKVFPLTVTRRCPKTVVALTQQLVPEYEAAPEAPEGIVRKAGVDRMETELAPGDAVVSRVNAPLAGICLRLIKSGIPAFIQGRDFGGEIATLAESLAEGQTTIDGFVTRVDQWETRKLGKISAHDDDDFDRKAAEITDRADCLLAFAETANRPGDIAFKIRSVFQDATGERKDCVVLSSTHKAKGLEWNRVFVLMSTYKVKSGPAPKGEDRNLTYVAWTRAKAELVLVQGEVGVTIGRRRITAENLDEHFEAKRDEQDLAAIHHLEEDTGLGFAERVDRGCWRCGRHDGLCDC